jgi:hypothetical protein
MAMNNTTRPKYMRVPIFAEYAGITVDRIYKLAKAGHIKLVRLGGTTLVDVDQAIAYLQSLRDYREVPTSYWGGATTPPRCRKKKPTGSCK